MKTPLAASTNCRFTFGFRKSVLLPVLWLISVVTAGDDCIGFYNAQLNADKTLKAMFPLNEALQLQFTHYASCNRTHPNNSYYPAYTFETFFDANFQWSIVDDGHGVIPGMQLSSGIRAYLRMIALHNQSSSAPSNQELLKTAVVMGDYLLNGASTADNVSLAWPNFPRSTGTFGSVYLPLTIAGQGDLVWGPQTIEPDKGAMAAVALDMLAMASGNDSYHKVAVHCANLLAKHWRGSGPASPTWSNRWIDKYQHLCRKYPCPAMAMAARIALPSRPEISCNR